MNSVPRIDGKVEKMLIFGKQAPQKREQNKKEQNYLKHSSIVRIENLTDGQIMEKRSPVSACLRRSQVGLFHSASGFVRPQFDYQTTKLSIKSTQCL